MDEQNKVQSLQWSAMEQLLVPREDPSQDSTFTSNNIWPDRNSSLQRSDATANSTIESSPISHLSSSSKSLNILEAASWKSGELVSNDPLKDTAGLENLVDASSKECTMTFEESNNELEHSICERDAPWTSDTSQIDSQSLQDEDSQNLQTVLDEEPKLPDEILFGTQCTLENGNTCKTQVVSDKTLPVRTPNYLSKMQAEVSQECPASFSDKNDNQNTELHIEADSESAAACIPTESKQDLSMHSNQSNAIHQASSQYSQLSFTCHAPVTDQEGSNSSSTNAQSLDENPKVVKTIDGSLDYDLQSSSNSDICDVGCLDSETDFTLGMDSTKQFDIDSGDPLDLNVEPETTLTDICPVWPVTNDNKCPDEFESLRQQDCLLSDIQELPRSVSEEIDQDQEKCFETCADSVKTTLQGSDPSSITETSPEDPKISSLQDSSSLQTSVPNQCLKEIGKSCNQAESESQQITPCNDAAMGPFSDSGTQHHARGIAEDNCGDFGFAKQDTTLVHKSTSTNLFTTEPLESSIQQPSQDLHSISSAESLVLISDIECDNEDNLPIMGKNDSPSLVNRNDNRCICEKVKPDSTTCETDKDLVTCSNIDDGVPLVNVRLESKIQEVVDGSKDSQKDPAKEFSNNTGNDKEEINKIEHDDILENKILELPSLHVDIHLESDVGVSNPDKASGDKDAEIELEDAQVRMDQDVPKTLQKDTATIFTRDERVGIIDAASKDTSDALSCHSNDGACLQESEHKRQNHQCHSKCGMDIIVDSENSPQEQNSKTDQHCRDNQDDSAGNLQKVDEIVVITDQDKRSPLNDQSDLNVARESEKSEVQDSKSQGDRCYMYDKRDASSVGSLEKVVDVVVSDSDGKSPINTQSDMNVAEESEKSEMQDSKSQDDRCYDNQDAAFAGDLQKVVEVVVSDSDGKSPLNNQSDMDVTGESEKRHKDEDKSQSELFHEKQDASVARDLQKHDEIVVITDSDGKSPHNKESDIDVVQESEKHCEEQDEHCHDNQDDTSSGDLQKNVKPSGPSVSDETDLNPDVLSQTVETVLPTLDLEEKKYSEQAADTPDTGKGKEENSEDGNDGDVFIIEDDPEVISLGSSDEEEEETNEDTTKSQKQKTKTSSKVGQVSTTVKNSSPRKNMEWVCHICGERNKTLNSLKLHVRRVHDLIMVHRKEDMKCKLCPFTGTWQKIKDHIIKDHNTPLKWYVKNHETREITKLPLSASDASFTPVSCADGSKSTCSSERTGAHTRQHYLIKKVANIDAHMGTLSNLSPTSPCVSTNLVNSTSSGPVKVSSGSSGVTQGTSSPQLRVISNQSTPTCATLTTPNVTTKQTLRTIHHPAPSRTVPPPVSIRVQKHSPSVSRIVITSGQCAIQLPQPVVAFSSLAQTTTVGSYSSLSLPRSPSVIQQKIIQQATSPARTVAQTVKQTNTAQSRLASTSNSTQPHVIAVRMIPSVIMTPQPQGQPQVQPQQVQPQQVRPQQVRPQQVRPQQVRPQQVRPQQVRPQQVQPKQVQPQVQPQQVLPQQVQPQQVQPQQVQPQQVQQPSTTLQMTGVSLLTQKLQTFQVPTTVPTELKYHNYCRVNANVVPSVASVSKTKLSIARVASTNETTQSFASAGARAVANQQQHTGTQFLHGKGTTVTQVTAPAILQTPPLVNIVSTNTTRSLASAGVWTVTTQQQDKQILRGNGTSITQVTAPRTLPPLVKIGSANTTNQSLASTGVQLLTNQPQDKQISHGNGASMTQVITSAALPPLVKIVSANSTLRSLASSVSVPKNQVVAPQNTAAISGPVTMVKVIKSTTRTGEISDITATKTSAIALQTPNLAAQTFMSLANAKKVQTVMNQSSSSPKTLPLPKITVQRAVSEGSSLATYIIKVPKSPDESSSSNQKESDCRSFMVKVPINQTNGPKNFMVQLPLDKEAKVKHAVCIVQPPMKGSQVQNSYSVLEKGAGSSFTIAQLDNLSKSSSKAEFNRSDLFSVIPVTEKEIRDDPSKKSEYLEHLREPALDIKILESQFSESRVFQAADLIKIDDRVQYECARCKEAFPQLFLLQLHHIDCTPQPPCQRVLPIIHIPTALLAAFFTLSTSGFSSSCIICKVLLLGSARSAEDQQDFSSHLSKHCEPCVAITCLDDARKVGIPQTRLTSQQAKEWVDYIVPPFKMSNKPTSAWEGNLQEYICTDGLLHRESLKRKKRKRRHSPDSKHKKHHKHRKHKHHDMTPNDNVTEQGIADQYQSTLRMAKGCEGEWIEPRQQDAGKLIKRKTLHPGALKESIMKSPTQPKLLLYGIQAFKNRKHKLSPSKGSKRFLPATVPGRRSLRGLGLDFGQGLEMLPMDPKKKKKPDEGKEKAEKTNVNTQAQGSSEVCKNKDGNKQQKELLGRQVKKEMDSSKTETASLKTQDDRNLKDLEDEIVIISSTDDEEEENTSSGKVRDNVLGSKTIQKEENANMDVAKDADAFDDLDEYLLRCSENSDLEDNIDESETWQGDLPLTMMALHYQRLNKEMAKNDQDMQDSEDQPQSDEHLTPVQTEEDLDHISEAPSTPKSQNESELKRLNKEMAKYDQQMQDSLDRPQNGERLTPVQTEEDLGHFSEEPSTSKSLDENELTESKSSLAKQSLHESNTEQDSEQQTETPYGENDDSTLQTNTNESLTSLETRDGLKDDSSQEYVKSNEIEDSNSEPSLVVPTKQDTVACKSAMQTLETTSVDSRSMSPLTERIENGDKKSLEENIPCDALQDTCDVNESSDQKREIPVALEDSLAEDTCFEDMSKIPDIGSAHLDHDAIRDEDNNTHKSFNDQRKATDATRNESCANDNLMDSLTDDGAIKKQMMQNESLDLISDGEESVTQESGLLEDESVGGDGIEDSDLKSEDLPKCTGADQILEDSCDTGISMTNNNDYNNQTQEDIIPDNECSTECTMQRVENKSLEDNSVKQAERNKLENDLLEAIHEKISIPKSDQRDAVLKKNSQDNTLDDFLLLEDSNSASGQDSLHSEQGLLDSSQDGSSTERDKPVEEKETVSPEAPVTASSLINEQVECDTLEEDSNASKQQEDQHGEDDVENNGRKSVTSEIDKPTEEEFSSDNLEAGTLNDEMEQAIISISDSNGDFFLSSDRYESDCNGPDMWNDLLDDDEDQEDDDDIICILDDSDEEETTSQDLEVDAAETQGSQATSLKRKLLDDSAEDSEEERCDFKHIKRERDDDFGISSSPDFLDLTLLDDSDENQEPAGPEAMWGTDRSGSAIARKEVRQV